MKGRVGMGRGSLAVRRYGSLKPGSWDAMWAGREGSSPPGSRLAWWEQTVFTP